MSIKVNYLQAGSYDAVDLVNEFAAMFSDGVLSGGVVTEHSPADLSVNVAVVKGIKSGLFLYSDAVVNVPITSNTSGYGRIDVIYCDMDNAEVSVLAGTPSSSPTAPVLTGNKIALAQVLVGNNVSVINTANITDVRAYSVAANMHADTWHDASLINSWTAYTAATYGTPGYTKSGDGEVEIQGALQFGTTGTVAFYLPVGDRPAYAKNFSVICSVADHVARVLVGADGAVEINYPNGATWVMLSGIKFKAA